MKRKIKRTNYHTIISLAGGQPSPVVIPFYQFNFKRAILIGTEAIASECEKIKDLLNKKFKKPVEIINTLAYSFSELKSSLKKVGLNSRQDIFANITGGTKPMSIQLLEWARDVGATIGYVSTETGKVILLKQGGVEELGISAKISIDEYLELHGYKCIDDFKKVKGLQKEFYNAITNGRIDGRFFNFNIENNEMINKELSKDDFKIWKKRDCPKVEVSVPLITNEIFKFNYLTGGGYWFENFLFNQLENTGYFDDIRRQMIFEKGMSRNELDILVIKNFKLGLISCKVRNKRKRSDSELTNKVKSKIADFNKDLNELISLQSFLGKYTRLFLVTTYCLSSHFKEKAKERGVIVYDIIDLQDLEKTKKKIAELMDEQIPST